MMSNPSVQTSDYYRLSFCTTAMGRLDHIRTTLLQNIANSSDYPDIEFVLLDYGSQDGLGDWVRSNASAQLESGRLVYFRLEGVKHYSHSHSKNVGFLASSGAAVCNIDADNITPPGFAFHLNDVLRKSSRSVACFGKAPRNTKGRLAMFRTDFLSVGGYDESLSGWGWDDKDLCGRLVSAGCVIQWLDPFFAEFIPHNDERRTENMDPEQRWKAVTSRQNKRISNANISSGRFIANTTKCWGSATVCRNFSNTYTIGVPAHAQNIP